MNPPPPNKSDLSTSPNPTIKSESANESNTTENIKSRTQLWYKINVFLYDLRHFRTDEQSQERLDGITDPGYLGLPYFTPEESSDLRKIIMPDGNTLESSIEKTLHVKLERRIKKRVESDDFRVCAAHDLAPIFERAFQIRPKDIERNKGFLELMKQNGLDVRDDTHWLEEDSKRKPVQSHHQKKQKRKKK
jgi:hypothetical protein